MSRKNWTDEKLFFRLINNKSDKTYWNNITELRSRKSNSIFNKSYELANSKIEKEKIIGIDILAQLGIPPRPFYKESLKLFFEIIVTETNPLIIKSLLYAIGHNNEKLKDKDLKIICSFKNRNETIIRESLVFALLGVNKKRAIETLIFLTNDKINSIRDWATFGIGTQISTINENIINALWHKTNDKDRNTREEAIVGLAKRKDLKIKEVIKTELLEGQFGGLILEAIEELNDKDLVTSLNNYITKHEQIDNEIWIDTIKECIENLKSS